MDGMFRIMSQIITASMQMMVQITVALIQGLVSIIVALINRPRDGTRTRPLPPHRRSEDAADLEGYARRMMKRPRR